MLEPELDFGSREACLEKLAQRIYTGFCALLLDLYQTTGKLCLPVCGFQFTAESVELDVGSRSIERDLLARIDQS